MKLSVWGYREFLSFGSTVMDEFQFSGIKVRKEDYVTWLGKHASCDIQYDTTEHLLVFQCHSEDCPYYHQTYLMDRVK